MLATAASVPTGLPESLPLNRHGLGLWRTRLREELEGNILPYWQRRMLDPNGGFYGGRDNDGTLRDEQPRTAVLGTRILWTFSTAARLLRDDRWHTVAEHAWAWLRDALWDVQHGGVYWGVDAARRPVQDIKHSYAQGFAIYALAAYHRLSIARQPLQLAQSLFRQLDAAAYDPKHGGYFEGCTRDWRLMADSRLSPKEPASAKSMNTMLHVLEGCTELLRVWRDATLEARVRQMVELFLQRIWQPRDRHFGLFFTANWRCMTGQVSYGHDIEAAWLLQRAAEVLGDTQLMQRTQGLAVHVADAVLARGVGAEGCVLAEGTTTRVTDPERHWWCQAEGMVGFWNAFEHHLDPVHAQAAWRCWRYAEEHHVDRRHGEWFKVLDVHNRPVPHHLKTGPWECPYHHARACFEMMDRLANCARRL